MVDGRRRDAWDRTSVLWALTAEINRDEKKQRDPFTPHDIHPFFAKQKAERTMTIGEAAKRAQAQESRLNRG